jgi:hypothetical protein
VSQSKERFGRHRGGGRWTDATPQHPCPICRHTGWCSISPDGATALCHRVGSGPPRYTRDGAPYWIHPLGPSHRREIRLDEPLPLADTERASSLRLDEAYRTLLAQLSLDGRHRDALEKRGLSENEIRRRGYRTLPREGRAALARAVVERIGESVARMVPGLYVRTEEHAWWSVAGDAGLLVPCVDIDGRIFAIKTRSDAPQHGSRYKYLSSRKFGGPRALQGVHVPQHDGPRDEVRVTEGEVKSDVCTSLSGRWTLGLPGVGSWRLALPVLAAIKPQRVWVAFDADYRRKPQVATALLALLLDLQRSGYTFAIEYWDESLGKGADDVLATAARGAA